MPVCEAPSAGPYSYFTNGKLVSSTPGSGSGGVSIAFYQRK